ncbi:MAG: hypothetical protein HYY16_02485 [Planctomycetes bacterium]|nr:hypothetical protein [Planctomycetota bacterium]
MKIALMLLIAAQAAPQEAAQRAKTAIENVRRQKSYRTEFTAKIKAPDTDALELKGEGLWVAGGILFIDYRASGGEHKRIVRVGDRAWIYHEMGEEWVPPEQVGMDGAGRGVQNPDEMLAVLVDHLKGAVFGAPAAVGGQACDVVEVRLAGADIEKMMKDQAQDASFDWMNSSAQAKAYVGAADGLIWRISTSAELASADPNIKGQIVRYDADVTVLDYNATYAMHFIEKTSKKEIGLDPAILEAVERREGVPQELLAEAARMREARIATLITELAADDDEVREAAAMELELFGRAAVPALRKALGDQERAERAKEILERIEE